MLSVSATRLATEVIAPYAMLIIASVRNPIMTQNNAERNRSGSRSSSFGLTVLALLLGFAAVLGSLYMAATSYVNPVVPLTIAAIGGACLVTGALLVGERPSQHRILLAVIATVLGACVITMYAPAAVVVFADQAPIPLYDTMQSSGTLPEDGSGSVLDLIWPSPDSWEPDYYPYWYNQVVLPFWPMVSAALSVLAVWLGWRAWPVEEQDG